MAGFMVSSFSPRSSGSELQKFKPRIPFYSTIKTIFLLYLALPQTQGATYVYQVHLHPFFAKHEHKIDQTIAAVRARAYRFLQEKVRAVWQAVLSALAPGTEAAAAAAAATQGPSMAGPTQPPPTMTNPAGGPAQLISSLWTSYGPSILAGGAALIRQTAAATLPGAGVGAAPAAPSSQRRVNPLNTPPGSIFGGRSSDQAAGRRRLDVELDQLSSLPQPIPPANNPAFSSSASTSSPSLRERAVSGKFEEEMKGGEFEGYEVDGDEFVGGFVPQQPNMPSRASWFGWGQGSRKDGYERVKTE
jgi:receptor expression-enhancing protein 1/2/3/4